MKDAKMNNQSMPDGTEILEVEPSRSGMQQMAGGQFSELIRVAHEYPRSIDKFTESAIRLGCNDTETACSCFYTIPRGGQSIQGPSVKFAQIVASTWGNLWVQCTPISQDSRFVTVRATAWDLETNVCIAFDVKRVIKTKSGQTYSDDMISVTTTAASAIAYRNAVLKIVPEAYTRSIAQEIRLVVRGDMKTLEDRRGIMLDWFKMQGVDTRRILGVVDADSIADIGLDELEVLHGVAQAFNDGMSLEELVPHIRTATGGNQSQMEALKDRLQNQQPAGDGKQGSEPKVGQDGEAQDEPSKLVEDMDESHEQDGRDFNPSPDDLIDAGLR